MGYRLDRDGVGPERGGGHSQIAIRETYSAQKTTPTPGDLAPSVLVDIDDSMMIAS